MALPKGKVYFGEAQVNFTLSRNLTDKDDTLFLDFLGSHVSNLIINDEQINSDEKPYFDNG